MQQTPLIRKTELRADPEMTRAFVQRGRANSTRKRQPVSGGTRTKTCLQCGVEFYDTQTTKQANGLGQQFCSAECFGAAQKGKAIAGYPRREDILRLYCTEGLSDRALGERYGHSYQWALGVRRAYGITADMKPRRVGIRRVASNGYVKVGDDWEHRLVMEQKIGRELAGGEVVHHIDKDTTNNHPDNLVLYPSHSEHMWDERGRNARRPRKSTARVKRRDWTAARQKVEAEGRCRVCGRSDVTLQAAHIIPRSRVSIGGGGEHIDNIVPLCAETCHPRFDAHQLDILPFLTLGEQAYAVTLCGGLLDALHRVTGARWVEAA